MLDDRILMQCRDWVTERTHNLDAVKNLEPDKREYYRMLFQISLYILKWYGELARLATPFGEIKDAERFVQRENYASTCMRLSEYYNSIASIANEDLKKSKNKQKENDEQTLMVAITMMRLIDYFKKTAYAEK